MLTKTRLMTAGLTIALIAIAMRTDQGRSLITGDKKFLGIF